MSTDDAQTLEQQLQETHKKAMACLGGLQFWLFEAQQKHGSGAAGVVKEARRVMREFGFDRDPREWR